MQVLPPQDELLEAVRRRDSAYEGVFVFAVRSTGVVCRPGCAARTPNPDNLTFYGGVRDALLAGYRPCKRCRPLEPLGAAPEWIRPLVEELERAPSVRIQDQGLRDRCLEPARVRRWFQKQHGMSFHAYQRARVLGAALGTLQAGDGVTQASMDAGYESESGFREAFEKLFGTSPGKAAGKRRVVINRILTPLGSMLAGATEQALVLLEFVDRRMLETQIKRLRKALDAEFVPGESAILSETKRQLDEYFAGERREFDLPLDAPGTEFQMAAWEGLHDIKYGETRSYGDQAKLIGRPNAVRAIGKANGDNRIAILIPCHRVIGADGKLTGYGGLMWRKQALLELERGERGLEWGSAPR